MNLEQARFNMIEQQIRPWEVLDQTVLDLIARMPREDFVPIAYRNLAFADIAIPLGHGEAMMPPKVEGRMLQALTIGTNDRVLEIGTGSGFMTALLASLAKQVISMDIRADFIDAARSKLKRHNIDNASLYLGDGIQGREQDAPYEVIAVTGSVPLLQEHWQKQLTIGGRLFVIVGQSPVMEARLITRMGDNQWLEEALFETDIPALQGAPQPPVFVF